jgi:hypothetical protein
LEAAAAADPAAAELAALEVTAGGFEVTAGGFVAAVVGWPPMICCSELNKLPKRFCAVPTGIGAAVLLEESAVGSSGDAFL